MRLSFSVGILLISLSLSTSFGASFDVQPFPEAVQAAPIIVRGKVGMSYSDWGKDAEEGTQRIYTFFELQISEVFKGGVNSATLTMRELGGEKEGTELTIPGAATFQKGEDVLVFLHQKNQEGYFDLQGMMTGKFEIEIDPNQKTEVLVGSGLTTPWTLDALRKLVKDQDQNSVKLQPSLNTKNLKESSASSPTPNPPSAPARVPQSIDGPRTEKEGSLSFWAILAGLMILAAGYYLYRRR